MHKKQLQRQGGYTLVELMLVLGLLTTLGGTGVHTLVQWQWRNEYTHTLKQIQTAVQKAQRLAQRGHQDYWLGVEQECIWVHTQSSGNCAKHGVLRPTSSTHWQPQFTHGHRIKFATGRGLSGFGAGRIRVQQSHFQHHSAAVIVSALGRVRICESESLLPGVGKC